MNLQGLNLRGLTVTFTFKDVDKYPSTEDSIKLLRVGASEISDYFIVVNATRVYNNADGTGYYYYDDVRFNNNTLSVDSYHLDPVTYTFPDNMDYYVHVHNSEYVSCDLTEQDLYTTISGKWKIKDEQALDIITTLSERVNFTCQNIEYQSISIVGRGYVAVSYQTDDGLTNYVVDHANQITNTELAVIDFGTEPQTVSQHFVSCLSMIAEPLSTISGKWEIIYINNLSSIPNDITQEVNFTSYGSPYTHLSISPSGDYIEGYKIVNGNYEQISSFAGFRDGVLGIWSPEIDFGSTPQTVSNEFLTYFQMIAIPDGAAATISGVWRIRDTLGDAPAPNIIQKVNCYIADNEEYAVALEFQALSGTVYSHLVKYHTTSGISWNITSPSDTIVNYSVVDFGEDPQEVSKDFIYWMNHMAEPWAKIGGLWVFNESTYNRMLDFSAVPLGFVEYVNFRIDDTYNVGSYFGFSIGGYTDSSESVRDLYYIYSSEGDSTCAYSANLTSMLGSWVDQPYRYLQFEDTQYVSKQFLEFMQVNAVEMGEGAIEPGEYCFKLDPYNAVEEFFANIGEVSRTIPIRHTVMRRNADGSDPDEQYNIYVGRATSYSDAYIRSDSNIGWSHLEQFPAQFRALGWLQQGDGTFQNRHINVLEKTYLTYEQYQFLNKVLIPLNSKRLLDTLGVFETAQSMKTITDLTIKYAKYLHYTPVADVLYYNASGAKSVTGLDFSKYLYVTVKARAGYTNKFIYPTSTSFAVRNIADCGNTMELQIADPAYYCVWNVTNTGITYSESGSCNTYLIYEIIGYRWNAALETIPEEPTPTYSYKYVRGQLSCPSGKYFNNFYNSDYGTEFRVELNFRLTSLGVELASNTASSNNNWKLSVNENGNLVMNNTYDGAAATPAVWTEFTVQPNVWYSLSLYSNNLTSTNYTTTKGRVNVSIVPYTETPTHSYVTKAINKWSQFSTTRNLYIGGDDVEIRNRILIKGTKYHSGATNTQSVLDVDVDNADIGGTISLTSNSFTLSGGYVQGATE